ncbi:hypothetical protein ACLM5J_06430 [Nocardioides sp. Bht2]|uniref:spermine/spermidine synthase domain-containing protein n=1 Tax=Nocardioides sp. Bht2 TaxID=3392297 RepID=UPI0039B6DA3D
MSEIAYREIARAESPRGEVVLRERRTEGASTVVELRVNGVFVMDTVETTSERALATVALAQVTDPAHVLVGGLGLGFTLREVLDDQRVQKVTCVELEESLVGWMRDGTLAHGPAILADQRVELVTADVAQVLTEAGADTFDLVLLDVDNGPDYLVHDTNGSLYQTPLLALAARATRQVLVVWSAAESNALHQAMTEATGNCTAHSYDITLNERAETYWLYVSRTGR